jgi:hypothetical protein
MKLLHARELFVEIGHSRLEAALRGIVVGADVPFRQLSGEKLKILPPLIRRQGWGFSGHQ